MHEQQRDNAAAMARTRGVRVLAPVFQDRYGQPSLGACPPTDSCPHLTAWISFLEVKSSPQQPLTLATVKETRVGKNAAWSRPDGSAN